MSDDHEIRAQFRESRCHHVVVAGFLTPETARELRTQIDAAPFTRFDIPDRGHYEHTDELALPALFGDLRAIAERITERALRLDQVRWLRLRHRDYQLLKDDASERPSTSHVELTLDVSASTTGQAELVYTDGHESWVVPQVAGALAIVLREPWLYRYARYLNHGVGAAVIHRLRLSLSPLDPPATG